MEGLTTLEEFMETANKIGVNFEMWSSIDADYSDAIVEAKEAKDEEKARNLQRERERIYYAYADILEENLDYYANY